MNDLTLPAGAGGAGECDSGSGDAKVYDPQVCNLHAPSHICGLIDREVAAHAATRRELEEARAQLSLARCDLARLQGKPFPEAHIHAASGADATVGNSENMCFQARYAQVRHAQDVHAARPAHAPPVAEHKEGEAHLRMLMRELTHRSKNLLAVVQAMARQSARQGGTVSYFLDHFSARLQALSRSHDLLVQESWSGVSLQDLVCSQLAQYLARERVQVAIEGPDIRFKPEIAQSLGLALHELAANAAKYGALSRSRGRVDIAWRMREGGLDLLWRESGGPQVKAPKRRGFGSVAIEHNLARVLASDVTLDFAAAGLQCRIFVPCGHFASAPPAQEPRVTLRR